MSVPCTNPQCTYKVPSICPLVTLSVSAIWNCTRDRHYIWVLYMVFVMKLSVPVHFLVSANRICTRDRHYIWMLYMVFVMKLSVPVHFLVLSLNSEPVCPSTFSSLLIVCPCTFCTFSIKLNCLSLYSPKIVKLSVNL